MADRVEITVPFSASWSAEDFFSVGYCRYAQSKAVMQKVARGKGRPVFAKPHMERQRQAIVLGLCDICGLPLDAKTKVSLSNAAARHHAAAPFDVLQVEPLLHKACAARALALCPQLKRQLAQGIQEIRQVFQWSVQFAVLTPQAVEEFTGTAEHGIVGHAKVHLRRWRARPPEWLEGGSLERDPARTRSKAGVISS